MSQTKAERKSDCDLVVTRVINGPAHLVFEAWTKPELFIRWWVPKSCGAVLLSCDLDARTGGKYRLVFEAVPPMEFFGRYIEVTPPSRLVWTNEEGAGERPVTTVTFEPRGEQTLLTVHDLYPSKEALEEAVASGSPEGMPETLDQLDALVVSLIA
jgi:uncharacterized protein YndB with AHSA1/START domain